MPLFPRRSDKAEALARVSLLAGLGKKQLMQIAGHVDEQSFPAGTMLTREGEMAHEAVIVMKGNVTVQRKGRKMFTRGPGDTLGAMSLIDGEPHSSTCLAEDECVVLVMSSRDFSTLMDTVPGLSRQVMATLSRRLRESDRKLDECLNAPESA